MTAEAKPKQLYVARPAPVTVERLPLEVPVLDDKGAPILEADPAKPGEKRVKTVIGPSKRILIDNTSHTAYPGSVVVFNAAGDAIDVLSAGQFATLYQEYVAPQPVPPVGPEPLGKAN